MGRTLWTLIFHRFDGRLLGWINVAWLCATLAAGSRPAHANPGCPSDTLDCFLNCAFNQPTYSTDPAASCLNSRSAASYDLAAGTFRASGGGDYCDRADVIASDIYTVFGLPPGTPVSFEATLRVRAGAGCSIDIGYYSSCSAAITDNVSGATAGIFANSPGSVDSTLRIPLLHAAGQGFTLSFQAFAYAGGPCGASVDAQLSFGGLPDGATVGSCQGYQQGSPTASRHGSWGALKTHYR